MNSAARNSGGTPPWVLVAGGFHQDGGMDKANAALAAYICARGVPLHLVSYRVAPDLAANPLVTVHRARKAGGSFFLGGHRLDSLGRAMAREVTGRFDDAHVVVNGANCDWPDINWVHFVHHAWHPTMTDAPSRDRLKNALAMRNARKREARVLPRARIVLANSERTRRDLIALLRLAPDRVRTVYLGTDSGWRAISCERRLKSRATLGIMDDRPLIAFVGALGHDSRKGFDTLWSAWQRLCARPEWDADLVVAGAGRALRRWQAAVAQSAFAARVRFIGHTDNVTDLLAASDLLVSPVRYEPYGLNVQEAICCGVPAIVSTCAGVAERYPAALADLLLPDPEDAAGLATRMRQWRAGIEGWRRRLKPFTDTLRAYSWDDMAERIVSLVSECRASSSPGNDRLRAAIRG